MNYRSIVLTAVVGLLLHPLVSPVRAQDVVNGLMHGELVYHGNYCGPGNKGRHPAPVDALDEACMHHDACTVDFQVPACSCNDKLRSASARIAGDPLAPEEERKAAEFTMQGVASLPCR
ncbi:hypothetical protein [Lichenibacterium ramalinae]|uniref:Phospholipase A2 domain-containing protein n=1 Tax=Lichenibacterium ramalinae TaxID=2316527 RepID=A0A4Q2R7F6_9HYPH|nr:hypothetical protein [Lichenibacterium ramalinae]RYB01673.1 hypothetical protein D3272_24750 [Lichenibacterium ramalinae]